MLMVDRGDTNRPGAADLTSCAGVAVVFLLLAQSAQAQGNDGLYRLDRLGSITVSAAYSQIEIAEARRLILTNT